MVRCCTEPLHVAGSARVVGGTTACQPILQQSVLLLCKCAHTKRMPNLHGGPPQQTTAGQPDFEFQGAGDLCLTVAPSLAVVQQRTHMKRS